MEIKPHPFETTIYSDTGVLQSKSFNPSAEVAESVIRWKFKNEGTATKGYIRNTETGAMLSFFRDEEDVVSSESGEILCDCPGCIERDAKLVSKQRDIKAWQMRFTNLKKELEEKAKDSKEWEIAGCLFDLWRVNCNHERSIFSFDRYLEIAPMLRKYGFEICVRAIAGASFDPYISTRKNGTKKIHNDFELVFRDSHHTEEYANKAKLPFKLSDYTDRIY